MGYKKQSTIHFTNIRYRGEVVHEQQQQHKEQHQQKQQRKQQHCNDSYWMMFFSSSSTLLWLLFVFCTTYITTTMGMVVVPDLTLSRSSTDNLNTNTTHRTMLTTKSSFVTEHQQIIQTTIGSTSSSSSKIRSSCFGNQNQQSRRRQHPLECWLQQLELKIPDQSFYASLGITVSIQNLICTNFTVDHIQSQYGTSSSSSSSSSNSNQQVQQQLPFLHFNVSSLSGSCNGFYHVTGGLGGQVSATLTKFTDEKKKKDDNKNTITNAMEYSLNVINYEDETNTNSFIVPYQINTTRCTTNLYISELLFSDSISAKILDLVRTTISNYITSTINTVLCPIVQQSLDEMGTDILQKQILPQYVYPYLFTNRTTTTSVSPNSKNTIPSFSQKYYSRQKESEQDQQHEQPTLPEILNYNTDVPLLLSILNGTNTFMNTYMNNGFVKHYSNKNHAIIWNHTADSDIGRILQSSTTSSSSSTNQEQQGMQQQQEQQSESHNSNKDGTGDNNTCGFFFDGINGVIREILTNDDIVVMNNTLPTIPIHLTFNINNVTPFFFTNTTTYNITIIIDHLTIQGTGLYKWKQLQILQPTQPMKNDNILSNQMLQQNPEFLSRLQQQQQQQQQNHQEYYHPSTLLVDTEEEEDGDTSNWITFGLQMSVEVDTGNDDNDNNHNDHDVEPPLKETFIVQWNTSYIDSTIQLGIDFDKDLFRALTIGTLFLSSNVHDNNDDNPLYQKFACLIEPLLSVQLLTLSNIIQLQGIEIIPVLSNVTTTGQTMKFRGDATNDDDDDDDTILENDIDTLLNNALQLFVKEYQPTITQVIHGFSKDHGTIEWINNEINTFIQQMKEENNQSSLNCSSLTSVSSYETPFYPFRENFRTPTKTTMTANASPNAPVQYQFANFSRDLPILTNLNTFLNLTHTLTKANTFFDCVTNYVNDMILNEYITETKQGIESMWLSRMEDDSFSTTSRLLLSNSLDFVNFYGNNSTGSNNTMLPTIRLKDFRFRNVGELKSVQLLNPSNDGSHLISQFQYGDIDKTNETNNYTSLPQLVISFEVDYKERMDISAIVNLTVTLNEFVFLGDTFIEYDLQQFYTTSIQKLLSKIGPQCLSGPMHGFDLFGLKTNTSGGDDDDNTFRFLLNSHMGIEFKSTTSKKFNGIKINIDSSDYPIAQELISDVYVWLLESISDVVDTLIMSHPDTNQICEPFAEADTDNDGDEDDDTDFAYGDRLRNLLSKMLGLFLLAQPVIFILINNQRTKPRTITEMNTVLSSQMEIDRRVPREREQQQQRSYIQNDDIYLEETTILRSDIRYEQNNTSNVKDVISFNTTSLMFHDCVPDLVKHLLPVTILGAIALLISSNLGVGATVDLVVSIEEDIFHVPALFSFSLANTAKEMWNAGIYPLLLLVVVFSGIWPYAKLTTMLLAWIIRPSSYHQLKQRGSLLLALDALGKFSLVDTYVLVLMMVAFRFHLPLTENATIDVYVTPQFGFYGFLVATCISMAIGHFEVYYHRKAELNKKHKYSTTDQCESIFQHKFRSQSDDRTTSSRQLSWICMFMLLSTLFVVCVLLGIGMTKESFVFDFGGLAGLALEDRKTSKFSLIGLGLALPSSIEFSTGLGIHLLQVAYFFYAVVSPYVCLLCILILMIYPLTLQHQLRLVTITEIANAWSAIEVFSLSIVASLLEISTFASFMVGHHCDIINKVLEKYNQENNMDAGDAVNTCYSVNSSVSKDAFFLLVGVVINSFFVSFFLRILHTAINERILEHVDHNRGENNSTNPEEEISFVAKLQSKTWTSWMFSTCVD